MTTLHTNPLRAARDWVKAHRFPGPVSRFAGASLLGALGVAALAAIAIDAEPVQVVLAAALFLVGALFAGSRMMRDHPHEALGLANLVTLARLGLTACLVVPIFSDDPASWPIFVLAITALCLDGIDGWLARWQRLSSRFGAAFDMEVDSALGLVLALNAFAAGTAGPAVLLLGLPHYLFAIAGRAQPWLRRPCPIGSAAKQSA